jgi:hypothetical protein
MFKTAFEFAYFALAVALVKPQIHCRLVCTMCNTITAIDFDTDTVWTFKYVVVNEVVDGHDANPFVYLPL